MHPTTAKAAATKQVHLNMTRLQEAAPCVIAVLEAASIHFASWFLVVCNVVQSQSNNNTLYVSGVGAGADLRLDRTATGDLTGLVLCVVHMDFG